MKATLTDTNATGSLSYQWFADDSAISGATENSYILTMNEIGKQISVVISSNEESGSLYSGKTAIVSSLVNTEDHIIINQVYGGGGKGATPLSHSFIELYNPTTHDIDLSQYEIGYMPSRGGTHAGNTGGVLHKKTLAGTLPAYSSYLIRCAVEVPSENYFDIEVFDLDWTEQAIDNNQYLILLYSNPTSIVDSVSVIESSLEGFSAPSISKQRSIRRVDFVDTNDNSADFIIVAYDTLANSNRDGYEEVRPRSKADGRWGVNLNPNH